MEKLLLVPSMVARVVAVQDLLVLIGQMVMLMHLVKVAPGLHIQ